jgi:hypothetical protein
LLFKKPETYGTNCAEWQNKKWVLCYSSFLHPTDKAQQFHSRCDKYTGTISLGWNSNQYAH